MIEGCRFFFFFWGGGVGGGGREGKAGQTCDMGTEGRDSVNRTTKPLARLQLMFVVRKAQAETQMLVLCTTCTYYFSNQF